MEKLTDHMRENGYENVNHAFFPGMAHGIVGSQWGCFVEKAMPELVQKLLRHLKSLRVPAMDEQTTFQVMPEHYCNDVAHTIDEGLPCWNLLQRTLMYATLIRTLYQTGLSIWLDIVRTQGQAYSDHAFNPDEVINAALMQQD